jgi:hypothetical protein
VVIGDDVFRQQFTSKNFPSLNTQTKVFHGSIHNKDDSLWSHLLLGKNVYMDVPKYIVMFSNWMCKACDVEAI